MRELTVVVHREFWERVRTKSFIISTILTPLFIIAFTAGPVWLATRQGGDRTFHLTVVDESTAQLGQEVASRLEASSEDEGRFIVTVLPVSLAQVSDSLTAALREDDIDGYLHLPPDIGEGGTADVVVTEGLRIVESSRMRAALTAEVQERRAAELGLNPGDVVQLLQGAAIDEVRLTEDGEDALSEIRSGAGFAVGFLLYMLILLYGIQVLRSAQEEKSNRIAEILVSSVNSSYLMLGKVLGVGLTALLQVSIWLTLLLTLARSPIAERAGISRQMLSAIVDALGVDSFVVVGVFVVLGFFLYSTLFAALGAAADTMEDAQRFTLPLTLPLIVPFMMSESILRAPDDTLPVVLSWVPLTGPMVMPMRYFVDAASPVEVVLCVVWLVVSVVAAAWVAGRIYRAGILNTGKLAWSDMARWVRAR